MQHALTDSQELRDTLQSMSDEERNVLFEKVREIEKSISLHPIARSLEQSLILLLPDWRPSVAREIGLTGDLPSKDYPKNITPSRWSNRRAG
jgi:hypothetical protein